MNEKIREYWEERANKNFLKKTATTDDTHLRDLEISTLIDTINQFKSQNIMKILDIGCGDGYSTLNIARNFQDYYFCGVDYSETMIKIANENLSSYGELKNKVNFLVGDVTRLQDILHHSKFDMIISDRCLINLDSSQIQYDVIGDISNYITNNGFFIAIENFIDGHNNMNNARKKMGLPEIPIRWHNKYFIEDEFIRNSHNYFSEVSIYNFSSSYYFATRVIYSAMCQMRGETPNYNHEIHQLATKLPWTGKFSPIKLIIMRK